MARRSRETTGDWIVSTVKDNPEAFLVLAAGAALLLRGMAEGSNGYERTRSREHFDEFDSDFDDMDMERGPSRRRGMTETVRQQVAGIAETASEYASDVGERVYETAAGYASAAADYADQGRRVVTRQAAWVGGQAQYAADRVMRDQPLAVAVLGLAAGAALAAMLPPTETEARTLSPARERLAEAANRTADRLKDAAGDVTRDIKAKVVDRVLSGDIAREAANVFTSSLKGESEPEAGRGAGTT